MRNRIRRCALCIALSLLLLLEPAFARPLPSALAEAAGEEAQSPEVIAEPAPAGDSTQDEGAGPEAELPPGPSGDAPAPDADSSDAQDAPAEEIASPEPGEEPSPLPSGDAAEEDGEALTPPRQDFSPEFRIDDGALTAYLGGDADVAVPGDLGISEIGSFAFAHNADIRSIRLPDCITVIGEGAFLDCAALERIVLPAGLRAVGEGAFDQCPLLTAVVQPDSGALRYCQAVGIPYELSDAPEALPGDAEVLPAPAEPEAIAEEDAPALFDIVEAEAAQPLASGSFHLENGDLTIGLKESVSGALRPAIPEGEAGPVSYRSSDENTVSVDSNGKLKGRKIGSAVITASLPSGETATCKVTVGRGPVRVTLSVDSKLLGVDERTSYAYGLNNGAGSYSMHVTSTNSSVVRVDEANQEIVAVGKGSAKVKVTAFNGKTASVKITVKLAPQGLKFPEDEAPLGVGMELPLCASYTNDGAAGAIAYSVPAGAKSSVNGDVLTAGNEESVTVTATAYNGVSTSHTWKICSAPTELTLEPEGPVTVGVGQTIAAPVTVTQDSDARPLYAYRTSDDKTATVSAEGAITGKKVGRATITVTAYNGIFATYAVDVLPAPAKIQIAVPSKAMGLGEEIVPEVTTPTAGAQVGSYTLSSNKRKIVEVQGDKIVAKGKGSATVTAKSYNGKKASVKISVKPAPEGLQFISSGEPLGVGMAHELSATYTNSGAAGAIRYEIAAGGAFASLDGNVLTANAVGSVTVRAVAYNNVSVEQTLEICSAPTTLTVSSDKPVEIGVNQTLASPVTVTQDSPARPLYRYGSSDDSIVTVSAEGALTGKKVGRATVTVTSYNGKSATYAVAVLPAPAKIQIAVPGNVMGVGEEIVPEVTTPTAGAVVGAYTLSSSSSKVIQIQGDKIIAKSKGSATVTAKSYNGKKASVKISVKSAPQGLQFTSSGEPLGVGMAHELSATYTNSGAAGAITYSIAQSGDFAALDGSVLTARAPGEVTVTASTYGGISTSQTLRICPAPTTLTVSSDKPVEIGVKQTLASPVKIEQDGGAAPRVSYSSSNLDIVTVSADGAITGKKAGSAAIIVTSYNGISARYGVTVRSAPAKIKIAVPNKAMGLGEEITPEVTTPTSGAIVGTYTLSSSKTGVVKVQGDKIVAKGKGSATVTAKSYNGKKASVNITVKDAPKGLQFASSGDPLGVGMALELSATYTNSGAAGAIRYEIAEGEGFASLEGSVLTADAVGSVTVRATAYNGVSATQALQIAPAPTALTAAEAEPLVRGVGERYKFEFTPTPANAVAEYRFTSSDSSVARVDADGYISNMKVGSAVITVTAHNGVTAQLFVRVESYNSLHGTDAIAHRGASAFMHENTLAAFKYAAELGAKWIETDVRLTSDNKVVLFHDDYIVSRGSRRVISSLTLAQLKGIDSRIPTLDEGLQCISQLDGMSLLIEFKSFGSYIQSEVLKAVKKYGMEERVYYDSFNWSCMKSLHKKDPNARVILVVDTPTKIRDIIKNPKKYNYIYGVSVFCIYLTANDVRDFHLNGLHVSTWTPLSASEIKKLCNMGVDGITTNNPELVVPYQK